MIRSIVMWALVMISLAAVPSAAPGGIDPGEWVGSMTLPTRVQVDFTVTLDMDEETGSPSGTISIPAQGVHDQKLDNVRIVDNELSFIFAETGAEFSGRLVGGRRMIVGTIVHNGQRTPFRLTHAAEGGDDEPTRFEVERVPQRWRGVAKLPGMDLEFMVTFTPAPTTSGWAGTIDIPLQGLAGFELKDVHVGDEIRFTVHMDVEGAPPPARFRVLKVQADKAQGSFTQAGSGFAVQLRRVDDDEQIELPRPQHPEPPYPYTEREIEYVNPDDGTTFAGTLTIPEGDGPHPAVLFITGSGPQDRDETIAGHKPFLVISDWLTRRGIATLRVDDRGVGGSGGDSMEAHWETLVGDTLAGVAFLTRQPEVDASRIGLIGHSEGGWIAPIAASRSDDISYLVLLAAPGVSGRELLVMQRDLIRKTAGVPDAARNKERLLHTALLNLIEEGAPEEEIAEALRRLAMAERDGMSDAQAYADRIARAQAPMMRSRWFRSVMGLDSREALRAIRIPVLALTGSLDLQVPPDPNLHEIDRALRAGGNTRFELRELEGLNHLLQRARTGLPGEYLMIQQTIAPEALELMSDWLLRQTGLEG